MDEIGLMDMVHRAARHAAARHSHIARNIANADTPDYRATDLPDFADTLDRPGMALKATRPGHMADPQTGSLGAEVIERPTAPAPNGNTVSLEHEAMQAIQIEAQHEAALSIYSNARDVIRAALGRR